MIENYLDEVMFDAVSDKLAVVFGVDVKNQRIDSVHIKSNMRRLGRIGIFSRTISKFLVNLKRHHRSLFDDIDETITGRYWGKKALAAFARVMVKSCVWENLGGDPFFFYSIHKFDSSYYFCQAFRMM